MINTRIIQNIAGHTAHRGELYRLTYRLQGENIIGIFDWEPYRDATYKRFDPLSVKVLKVSQISPPPFPWVQFVVVDVVFRQTRKFSQVFTDTHFRPEGADMHLEEVLFIESGDFPAVPGSIRAAVGETIVETIHDTAEVAGEAVGAGIGGVVREATDSMSTYGKTFMLGLLVVGGIWGVSKILN